MTADIELLPMPSPQVPFIDCDPSMSDIRRLVRWYEQGATEHARANVAHAVATLQAEVEALQADVERLNAEAEQHFQQAMSNGAKARAAKAHAERLAEALREAADMLLADYPETAKRMRAACCPTAAQENDDA